MNSEESLYGLYTEVINKEKRLAVLKEEIDLLEFEKKGILVKQKLETLTKPLNNIVESQKKVNSKKAATIQKLHCDNSESLEKENILLTHKYQKDFKNVVTNISNIKTLLSKSITNQYDLIENHILTSSSLNNDYNKQLVNDIHNFKSCEGLYNNILLKNQYIDTSMKKENTESDLGCRPIDDSNSVKESFGFSLSPISSSSPILKSNLATPTTNIM